MRKVFGIGLNKTGTTTLGVCLRTLGYRHLSHSRELTRLYREGRIAELMEVARAYDSFEDWPWPLMFRELAEEFPDARFVLTVRKAPEVWLKSLTTHSYKLPPSENYHELVYGYKYPLGHKAYHLAYYTRHNAEVIEYFRERPGRLLVQCWEKGDDWQGICDFLGKKPPSRRFPVAGATREWRVPLQRMLLNRALAIAGIVSRNSIQRDPAGERSGRLHG